MVIAGCLICFLPSKPANAITFAFTGNCTEDCIGTAVATLVLQNYTVGNTFSTANFVSFTYSSNFLGTIVIPAPPEFLFGNGSGQFTSLPGPANVFLQFLVLLPGQGPQFLAFSSFTNGLWCIGVNACAADAGNNGIWAVVANNAVPLPAALPLFAGGLGALGLLGWRRKRKALAA